MLFVKRPIVDIKYNSTKNFLYILILNKKKLHNFVAVNSPNTETNAMKLLFLVITFCAQAFGVVNFPPPILKQTLCLHADNDELYERLDSVIAHRTDYYVQKDKKIEQIKLGSAYVTDKEAKLQMYERLVNEYSPYIYDSAMVYTQKGIYLARQANDSDYYKKFQIIKARLLVSRSFYIEAKEILDNIEVPPTDRRLNYLYNCAQCALYFNLKLSTHDTEYGPRYDRLFHKYMDNALLYSPQKDAQYYYMKGVQLAFSNGGVKDIEACLSKAMSQLKPDSRLYGKSAFIMAKVYGRHHQPELQERYLLLAAISDVMSATNENMALQEVALRLYKHDVRKAQRYINVSLNDANVFSSQPRRIDLYSNLHTILSAYNHALENAGKWHIVLMLSIIVLLVVIVVETMRIKRKNNLMQQNEKNLTAQTEQTEQLSAINSKQKEANEELEKLNDELEQTNTKREYMAKAYISLCYLYIEKLENQRKMVIRKIKANQQKELLSILSSSKRTAEENQTFFSQFDSIFLSLYPSFVTELNTLLTPEAQVELKENNELTPSLRVAALIRLGITESSMIAGILSYSPQTIYNYRSALKNGAIDKDSFEENLQRLCAVY